MENLLSLKKTIFKKNQEVIITIIEDSVKDRKIDLKRYVGVGVGVWKQDAQDFVKELRNDDRK